MNRPVLVTFNYESWPLATHFELMHNFSKLGLKPVWLDMTGILRKHFEFPLSDRIHVFHMRRKLHNLFPNFVVSISNYCDTKNAEANSEVIKQAELVAYQELISLTRNSKPCIQHNRRIYNEIKRLYIRDFQFALNFLSNFKPSELILFNGRFVEERAFWDAAKVVGCEVKFYETFIHTWQSRYFMFEEPTHKPSYRGKVMEEFGQALAESDSHLFEWAAREFFENRARGNNKFTENQDKVTNFETDLPIISFFHSSQDELVMVNLVDKFWTSQEMAVLELVALLDELGGHRLIIRIHPHLLHKSREEQVRWNRLGESLALKFKWVTFIPAEGAANTYDLIRSSKLVITTASTVGVEASYFEKPSVLLGRAFHENMGITVFANSRNQLRTILQTEFSEQFLSHAKFQAMKYGAFLQLGGQEFSHVEVLTRPRLIYKLKGVTISKSLFVRIIQHVEIIFRRFLRNLKFSVLCDHDCRANSR